MIWPFSSRAESLTFIPGGREAPPLPVYYPSVAAMSPEQRRYYAHFTRELSKGRALDVGQSVSYVFCHCYELHASADLAATGRRLLELSEAYAHDAKLSTYCSDWAVDALIGQRRYKEARRAFRDLPLDQSGSIRTDVLLSLKMKLKERPSGRDVLTLEGPKVTRYARDHLDGVATIVDAMVDRLEAHEGSLLADWAGRHEIWRGDHHLFNGSPNGRKTSALKVLSFSRCPGVLDACRRLTREAENSLREERGVPHISEGWVAETELFHRIKKAFPQWTVVHHGRPSWLGRQHLDVYIEEIAVALEYQGSQHYGPVAFFGGDDAFRQTQERDARKAKLCERHGVKLIVVDDGYSAEHLIATILAHSAR